MNDPLENSVGAVVTKPSLVLCGRPNVGKSTLFNRLTHSRDALVGEVAGLTRDRRYGEGQWHERSFYVVDTAGIGSEDDIADPAYAEARRQSQMAWDEADVVLLLVHARQGLNEDDRQIAHLLRDAAKPVLLVANHADGVKEELLAEFYSLGLGEVWALSALHGDGLTELMMEVFRHFPPSSDKAEATAGDGSPVISVFGRPNVGKSTLTNALLGEERMLVFDQPGTTRDALGSPLWWKEQRYWWTDTAGIRRKSRITGLLERLSVTQALRVLERTDVAVLLLDGTMELSDQDLHLAGLLGHRGGSVLIGVNKWDAADAHQREMFKTRLKNRLVFLPYAPVLFMSAQKRQGLGELMTAVARAVISARARYPTHRLTKLLMEATTTHPIPMIGRFRPKLRYAHQGGNNPVRVVLHGSHLEHLPPSYLRYLEGYFRQHLGCYASTIKVDVREKDNPFAE